MKYKYVSLFIAVFYSIFYNVLYTYTVFPTSAQASLNSEWNTISALTPNLLRLIAQSVHLNTKNGAVGFNDQGYKSVVFQRHSSEIVTYGILTKNVQLIDAAVQIIEYAFAHQQPDGSFLNNLHGESAASKASAVAFFYQDLGHSLLLCKNSNWFQRSKDTANVRVSLNRLIEPANTSLTWLMRQKAALWNNDRRTTNRVFFDAVAYYLVGKALKRSDAISLGKDFARSALQQQTKAGFFLENGGYDTSYQGVSLRLALLLYTNLKPDEVSLRRDLWMAIERGIRWELNHILPTGEVSTKGNTRVHPGGEKYFGKEKSLDYTQLIIALNYYSKLSGDPAVQRVADQLLTFRRNHRGYQKV